MKLSKLQPLCAVVLFAAVLSISNAFAAFDAYLTVEGTKQGKFKGDSPRDAHKDHTVVLGFDYEVKSPRDAATGQPSGKRQHQPLTVIKEWGPATPQLFQALVTNEVLKTVRLEFFRPTGNGAEEVFHTIELTNATVSSLKDYNGSASVNGKPTLSNLEEVSFYFQKITIMNKDGKTEAQDDWGGGR